MDVLEGSTSPIANSKVLAGIPPFELPDYVVFPPDVRYQVQVLGLMPPPYVTVVL